MKRITLVTDAWHPQVNGVVHVCETLIRELSKRGMEVTIIEPSKFHTMPLPYYPEIRLALFPRRRLKRELLASKPDAIHILTEGSLGLAARSVCVEAHLRFTTSYHTDFLEYLRVRNLWLLMWLGKPFLLRLHNAGEHTMVATPSLAAKLSALGFKNLVLWPLGIDTGFFKRVSSAQKNEEPCFGYVGRLAPEKSIEEFLKADLPGTKLIVGDGPSRKELERKYAGPKVHFVGYKKGVDLVAAYSEMDVFVFPSRTETFGLVVVEALACGVPVAAHDASGVRDIITNGKDGILDEDLAKAAKAALTLSPEACRTTALKYSNDASTEAFLQNLVPVK